jgi:hypothetical protein
VIHKSKADRLRAKLARVSDPYWRAWLESAIRFAEWEARRGGTGYGSLASEPEPPGGGGAAG